MKKINLTTSENKRLEELAPLHTVLVTMADENGNIRFPINLNAEYLQEPINELDFYSGRCNNVLKRAGIKTIIEIVSLKNIGKTLNKFGAGVKTINKIMHSVCEYYYLKLPTQKEKNEFLLDIVKANLYKEETLEKAS